MRYRGQYCYVAALLPGHREPTPILRLRYQGSADHWAIAIYKASSGQYSESELHRSFGPATGTPEQGIDGTFILYAAPEPKADRAHRDLRGTGEDVISAQPRCHLESLNACSLVRESCHFPHPATRLCRDRAGVTARAEWPCEARAAHGPGSSGCPAQRPSVAGTFAGESGMGPGGKSGSSARG